MKREDRITLEAATAPQRLASLSRAHPILRDVLDPFQEEALLNIREDNDHGLTVYLAHSRSAQDQAQENGVLISQGHLGMSSRWLLGGGLRLVLVDPTRVTPDIYSLATVQEALNDPD